MVCSIVNMQVINSVGQVGNIELYIAAFGELLPQQVTMHVVQTNVESRFFSFSCFNGTASAVVCLCTGKPPALIWTVRRSETGLG